MYRAYFVVSGSNFLCCQIDYFLALNPAKEERRSHKRCFRLQQKEQLYFTTKQRGNNKMKKLNSKTANNPNARTFKRRIGQTTYRVGIHFNQRSRETIDDKIIRLVRNESTGRKAVKR